MNGRALIVVITGGILIAGAAYLWLVHKAAGASRPFVNAYAIAESRNISETAAAMAVQRLKQDPDWRGDLFEAPLPLFRGTAAARAEEIVTRGRHVIRIEAVGRVENHSDTTFVSVEGDSVSFARTE